jgi:hypothetical protein
MSLILIYVLVLSRSKHYRTHIYVGVYEENTAIILNLNG